MDQDANINVPTVDETPETPDTDINVTDYENFKLIKKSFDGAKKGFDYYVIEYKNLPALIAKFGEAVVVAMVNSFLVNNMRVSATNALPKEDTDAETKVKWQALIDKGETCLLTEQEAIDYAPGREREPSTSAGFMKLAKAAQKAGDIAMAKQYLKRAQELLVKEYAELENI